MWRDLPTFSRERLVYADYAAPYSRGYCTRRTPLNAGGDADLKVPRKLRKATAKMP